MGRLRSFRLIRLQPSPGQVSDFLCQQGYGGNVFRPDVFRDDTRGAERRRWCRAFSAQGRPTRRAALVVAADTDFYNIRNHKMAVVLVDRQTDGVRAVPQAVDGEFGSFQVARSAVLQI